MTSSAEPSSADRFSTTLLLLLLYNIRFYFFILNIIFERFTSSVVSALICVIFIHINVCVCVCARRTNSDSALHTSVMNPPAGDPFSAGLHRPSGQ